MNTPEQHHHRHRRSLLQRVITFLRNEQQRWNDAQWPILLFFIGCSAYVLSAFPAAEIVLLGMLVVLAMRLWGYIHKTYFDLRIRSFFGSKLPLTVHTRTYPIYKWVDIFHAAEAFASTQAHVTEIRQSYKAHLQFLLPGTGLQLKERSGAPTTLIPRKTGYTSETLLPNDIFWFIRPAADYSLGACIIRVRFFDYSREIALEIAVERPEDALSLLDILLRHAEQQSIYRNQLISPRFAPEMSDTYREVDESAPFDLVFLPPHEVTDSDIVLSDTVRNTIEWTVIDFHQRREALMRVGLPGRRGILFYGPPGTGKTYTCKYIAHRLTNTTIIVATGPMLGEIKTICHLAKMFQPALVILEDVDLIFTDRTMNPYAPILGEFLEQLDGFRADDHVIFLLTTNAIERVESAIKDRPGRISQCIYLGPPDAILRRRYLQSLMRPYDAIRVDLDQLVKRTEGVSQAFLKELVFRAVQFATKLNEATAVDVVLDNRHFTDALSQMIADNDRWGKRIIGFHVDV